MKRAALKADTLLADLQVLEQSLQYWRWVAPDIRPFSLMQGGEISDFVQALYRLASECLAMKQRVNLTAIDYAADDQIEPAQRTQMIALTSALLWCCDMDELSSFRRIEPRENHLVRLLEQCHYQLIGAEYGSRPGEQLLTTDDYGFRR